MVASGDGDVQLIEFGPAFDTLGLVHRVHVPADNGPHPVLVLVHGLQGTEDAPWIFARSAGPEWLIVSPRAPFPAEGGHSWNSSGNYDDPDAYQVGLAALTRFVEGLADVYPIDRTRLVMLGFSQGAAISYAFATAHPVIGLAALAGFVPRPFLSSLQALNGVPVIILHGTEDQRVPIDRARQDRVRLTDAGAEVTYVEDHVGHKVSVTGLRILKEWLAARL